MVRSLTYLILLILTAFSVRAQTFEVVGLQDSYRGVIGETIKIPVHLKNTSDKPISLVIRRLSNQLGTTQKNYFCIDNNCLDQRTEDYILKIEPGQTISSLHVALEAGLAQGISSARYIAYNRSNPSESFEFDMNFVVEEKPFKEAIYSSNIIILHDVYPNPVKDNAVIDYTLLNEHVKAKISLHNILGNVMEEYPLPYSENKVKIHAESMNAGIYFYTLYIDGEGLITRKIIIRK
jgi:hypothetical protein